MSNKDIVLNNELFQKKVKWIKESKNSDSFPHLAPDAGTDRLLQLRVVDPDIACATLSFIMYGKDNMDLLPGFEWQSTGIRNNGGFISTEDIIAHLTTIQDQVRENPTAFFKDLGLYDSSTTQQVVELFIQKMVDGLQQGKFPSNDHSDTSN